MLGCSSIVALSHAIVKSVVVLAMLAERNQIARATDDRILLKTWVK